MKYYKSIFITEDHADRLRPVLQWVNKAAPYVQERRLASSLLAKIRRVKDWTQILLTRKENELLTAVNLAFPEGATPEGHQYTLPIPEPGFEFKEEGESGPRISDVQSKCYRCHVYTDYLDKRDNPACSDHGGVTG